MDETSLEDAYKEFTTVHYPNLFKYIVAIAHEDADTGSESIGTGVMVRLGGHHLVATAAHCIKRNPRVMHDDNFYMDNNHRLATTPPVRIIQSWSQPSFDIGFLEVEEALGPEMDEAQLCSGLIQEGPLHIVGHPICRIEVNERTKELTLVRSVFSTIVIEQTDSYLKLDYPKYGFRVEGNQWVKEPFIPTPHGFSGGGCFGVSANHGDLQVIGYKLLGIQASWHPTERWVEVVPIRHLLEGIESRLGPNAP
jgi:hypothetical protein